MADDQVATTTTRFDLSTACSCPACARHVAMYIREPFDGLMGSGARGLAKGERRGAAHLVSLCGIHALEVIAEAARHDVDDSGDDRE